MNTYDIFGYVSIIFSVAAFLERNTPERMLGFGMISAGLLGVSLYGYGGFAGAFVSIMSVLAKAFSMLRNKSVNKMVRIFTILGAFLFAFTSSEGVYGVLPALGMIAVAYADTRETLIGMKRMYMVSATLWLLYALHLGSPSAILYDVVGVAILYYSIRRIRSNTVRF